MDDWLEDVLDDSGVRHSTHLYLRVHAEMLLQVVRDYAGIGDFRTLTASEIRFFYDGLRAELRAATKPIKRN